MNVQCPMTNDRRPTGPTGPTRLTHLTPGAPPACTRSHDLGLHIGHWPLDIGRSLDIGHWSLVIPQRSLAIRQRHSRASGFTLIELTISSALMVLILVSAYACLSSSIASRKLIEARAEAAQSARVALALLSADLRGACPISKDLPFL